MALTHSDKEVSLKKKNLTDAMLDKLHNVCAKKHDSGGRGGLKWRGKRGIQWETLVDYISSPWAWPFQFQLEFFYLQCYDGYQLSEGNTPSVCVCVDSRTQAFCSTLPFNIKMPLLLLDLAEHITRYMQEYLWMCTYLLLKHPWISLAKKTGWLKYNIRLFLC